MIDIRTASTTTDNPLYLPFDWRMLPVAADRDWVGADTPYFLDAGDVDVEVVRVLQLDDTLHSAVIISLFSDRRANDDTVLPVNQTDRRGWCGDEYMAPPSTDADLALNDRWGSDLWLCYITKATTDILERARFAAWEALQWLVRGGIAERVDVLAEWTGPTSDRLALRPRIYEAKNLKPVYDVLWATSIRKVFA